MLMQPQNTSLLENLALFRWKRCSDRRDMVYSLLCISSDAAAVKVDYDRSLLDLSMDIARKYEPSFCLCLAKLLFYSMGMGVQELSFDPITAIWVTPDPLLAKAQFASIRARKVSYNMRFCGCCLQSIELRGPDAVRAGRWKYVHCLRCEHQDGVARSLYHHYGHLIAIQTGRHTRYSILSRCATAFTVGWQTSPRLSRFDCGMTMIIQMPTRDIPGYSTSTSRAWMTC